MKHLWAIALGGALGALFRYKCARYIGELTLGTFPWGTLTVNVAGCFVLGLLYELSKGYVFSAHAFAFLTIGCLGAFTTFSTFSLETVNLLRQGRVRLFALNLFLSNALGLVFVLSGLYAGRGLLRVLK